MRQASFEKNSDGTHVLHNQPEVVVRCAKQVWTDDSRKVIGRHVVLLFIVHNAVKLLNNDNEPK